MEWIEHLAYVHVVAQHHLPSLGHFHFLQHQYPMGEKWGKFD